MGIEIKLTFENIGEALKALARINCTEAKVDAAVDAALGEALAQPAEEVRRRARKTKAEAVQEATVAAAVVAGAPAEAAAVLAEPPPVAPIAPPTKEECSAALIAFAQKHSKDEAFKLLQKYNAANVSAVSEAKRSAFLADCRA